MKRHKLFFVEWLCLIIHGSASQLRKIMPKMIIDFPLAASGAQDTIG